MEVSGEAADLVMKEGVQISEEAIKLLARGAKNLAAARRTAFPLTAPPIP